MKILKKGRVITLIALVVTIIVPAVSGSYTKPTALVLGQLYFCRPESW